MKMLAMYLVLPMLCLMGLTANGVDQITINVDTAWIDGNETYNLPQKYIAAEDGKYELSEHFYKRESGFPKGFTARVTDGHEVSCWSWSPTVSVGDQSYEHVIHTSDKFLPWQTDWEKYGKIYLGVHLNWLKYTISFNGNGGSGSMAAMNGLVYNVSTNLIANAFKKTGYTMSGWSTSTNATEAAFKNKAKVSGKSFGLDYKNKSVTLYAVWTPKEFTVTLDAQEGAVSSKTVSVTYAAAYSLPTPTRKGYTFNGWYTAAEHGSKVAQEGISSFASDVTLYAYWTINTYTLSAYKSGAGEGSITKEPSGNSYNYGTDVQLNATPATGSRFVKWNDGETGATRTVTVISNMTYTARFDKEQLTVRFYYYDAQGNHTYRSESVEYGKNATLPSDAEFQDEINHYPKHHWTGEWSTSYTNIRQDENIDAKYAWNGYTIRFSAANKTSGSMSDQTAVLETEKLTLKSNVFARNGYQFSHWYCASLNRSFEDGATVEHLTTKNGESFEFEAVWSPMFYTVALEPNGDGAEVDPESIQVAYDDVYGELPIPKREGYSFDGWYTSPSRGERIAVDTKVTRTQDHTLYARWTAKTYTVSGNGVNGSFTLTLPATGTFDKGLYLSWTAGSETGYTFTLESVTIYAGSTATGTPLATWTTGTSATYTMTDTYYPAVFAEVKYRKTANEYTVTFNAGSGTTPEASRKVAYRSAFGELPVATRDGYDFGGWYDNSSYTGSPVTKDTVLATAANKTLYAKWTAKTYGVTVEGEHCTISAAQVGTFDAPLVISWMPEIRTGYTYKIEDVKVYAGTTKSDKELAVYSSGTSASFTMSKPYFENVHIVGTYRETAISYTLTFKPDGGTVYPRTKQVVFDSAYGELPKPTREGYEFLGWFNAEGDKIDKDDIVSVAADEELVAKWRKLVYTIVFNPNGATEGTMEDVQFGVKESGTMPANVFSRTGYTFLGWAKTKDEADALHFTYADEADVPIDFAKDGDEVNLFAVWMNNAYTVRFYPNGGEGEPYETFMFYDIPTELTKEEAASHFTRDGYEFDGWLTDPANTEVLPEVVSNLTAAVNGVVGLYAKWMAKGVDEPTELERAADCDTTVRGDHMALKLSGNLQFAEPYTEGGVYCVKLTPITPSTQAALTITVSGKGTLTFKYKSVISVTSNTYSRFMGSNLVANANWQDDGYVKTDEKQETITWEIVAPYNHVRPSYLLIDEIKWKPEEWDKGSIGLTFRLNDGTVAPTDIITNMTWQIGSTVDAAAIPPLPEKDGVCALGWSTNRTANAAMDMSVWKVPAADTQLYAVWKASENPVPTEGDRPVIGEGFKFTTDARFDYVIWKKNDLTEADWTKLKTVTGNGQPVALPMFVDQQGFFKVEVIQRGSK